ncbi:MAG: tetraacyldisaccharide 4'-kinase [Marinobacterium sp.]|nr:tetraacyldisaccharide 4'-kinase [Marinobacterium sp.]
MTGLEQRWYSNQRPPWYLQLLEPLYRTLSRLDRQRKQARQWRAPVPVIVVGNITVGGTGKTPLVTWLVEILRQAGYRPGIVSRGYKATPPAFPYRVSPDDSAVIAGDEPLMLARRCRCPLVIDPQRVRAAQHLLATTDCNLIISDDGLQHLMLDRDIELVVLDGARGLGNGHCLPAGPLREPATRLNTVDFVICNGVARQPLPRQDAKMRLQPRAFYRLANADLSEGDPEPKPLSYYKGQTVNAVAGIGNPQRFFDTLTALGIDVIPHAFADHHTYQADELQFDPPRPLLTTEKDAVKWQGLQSELAMDAAWLEIEAQLPDNFRQALLIKLAACYRQAC